MSYHRTASALGQHTLHGGPSILRPCASRLCRTRNKQNLPASHRPEDANNWPQRKATLLQAAAPTTAMESHAAASQRDATASASTSGLQYSRSSSKSQSSSLLQKHRLPSEAARAMTEEEEEAELHDAQLYEEIKACETWEDVMDVIVDEIATMKKKRAVQALAKLANLSRSAPRGTISAIQQHPAALTLVATIYTHIPKMKLSQLTTTMAALSQLRMQVPQPAREVLAAHAALHSPSMDGRDLATVMHALAVLGCKLNQAQLDTLGFRAHVLLARHLARLSPPQDDTTASSSAPAAADTVNSKKSSKKQPGAAAAAAAASAQHEPLLPQSVSMLLYSAAVLEYKNTRFLNSAVSVVLQEADKFTPQGLSNALWAATKLGYMCPPLVTEVLAQLRQRPDSFKPQEICNVMWALTEHRYHPQDSKQDSAKVMIASLVSRVEALKPPDYAALFHCLGTFCIQPGPRAMAILCKHMEGVLDAFSPNELCNVFWGLALIGETGRPIFGSIGARLPTHFDAGHLNEGLLRQSFQALLLAKMAAADSAAEGAAASSSPVPVFPPLMLDTMKRSWVAAAHQAASASGSPALEVASVVRELRVRHEVGRPTKDALVSIDLALQPSPERFVALQVLRPHEHTVNTGQFLGPVVFERQILERNGWEVKYLRAADFFAVEEDMRPLFVAELLANIGCRVSNMPGAPTRAGTQAAAAGRGASAMRGLQDLRSEAEEASVVLDDPAARGGARGAGGRARPGAAPRRRS